MTTNKITIGMMSSYSALNNRSDWLWQQTPGNFGIWDNIQLLATHPKPDFLLMYNYTSFPKPPHKHLLFWKNRKPQANYEKACQTFQDKLRGMPKERVIYLLREPPLDEVVESNKRFYKIAKNYCNYISGPDDFAPNPDYMPAIWYYSNSFRELNEMPPPVKEKPLSWVTSGINRTENHRKRLAFLKMLRDSGLELDLYGRGLPDWAKGSGELGNKWYGTSPYYYNLSVENYADNDWYVSEKLWDSLLAWCLPIYYGGPAADKLLPPGSFLRLPSMDEKGLAYIKEVTSTPDAWYEAKEAIAEARQIILHKLNLVSWLSNYVNKIS
ncbi:MAG: glycosyltransferase family 10 [Rivularia sp. ALOHA_DT_140]|nr:glycosyltransferase family 10 [Rivularia sp. ALOHA_DT_140]